MEPESMNVTLSPHGAEMLRAVLARHPELSPSEIVEDALSVRFAGEQATVTLRSPEEVRAWLDRLAALSDRIPPRPDETFSREMIYRDHP
jgi:hypothetical protein